jgi:chemotaxis protein MotD
MMPGIAIQPVFPIAAPPARNASTTADDHFSRTLHGNPKAGAQADGHAVPADKSTARDDEGNVDKTTSPHRDQDDKITRTADTDDKHDTVDDEEAKKDGDDEDDQGGCALPLHMKAERVLAQQWPAAGPAAGAGDGSATTDARSSGAPAGAAAIQVAGPVLSTGEAVMSAATALPAADANSMPQVPATSKAEPVAAAITAQPATAPATQPLAAQAQAGMDGPPVATGAPSAADPIPASVSVSAATATGSGNAPAAFLAKVAAFQHGADPAPSAQGTGGSAATPAPQTDAAAKIAQPLAGQDAGNAGADPDSQGRGDDGGRNKPAQAAMQPSSAAKADTGASPLPTAQMVPASGSAASFAAALAQGGRLARYTSSAASTAAAGAPAAALPVQSLRIQLRPVELGTVTANLKYSGSQLTIDIEVQTPDAQRRLSSDSSDIVKSLQSLGLQVDKVTVRQVQPQAQMQAQVQGQPTARDGSAGGFGNQSGGAFSMSGQSGAGQHRQGSESGNEDATERGIGSVHQAADRRQPRRGVFI